MILIKNITKKYPSRNSDGEIIALNNVSFDIGQTEFISIVGRSGAGKTTLLKLILAEETPDNGEVIFNGVNIFEIAKSEIPILRQKIGVVFQDYKLFQSKTVRENIGYVMEVIGASDEDIDRDVPQILDLVGLSDKINNFPAELSGGEKQRVAIARALIHRPEIILADEPTGNLDPYNTYEIIELLLKINKMGTSVVLATHDKAIINKLSKRVITIEDGAVIRDEKKGKFII